MLKQNNLLIKNIYKSRRNILTILKDYRGYDTTQYESFNIHELEQMYINNQLDMLITNKDTNKKIFIKYNLQTKQGVCSFSKLKSSDIYDNIEDIFDIENILDNSDELIIICNHKINETIVSSLENIYLNDNKFVNIYNLNDYTFNIQNLIGLYLKT